MPRTEEPTTETTEPEIEAIQPPSTNDQPSSSQPLHSRSNQRTYQLKDVALTTTVNYPTLVRFDPNLIRKFLVEYDTYVNTIQARALQLDIPVDGSDPTASRPLSIKYCCDTQAIKSAIENDFISNAHTYEQLSDDCLRDFLEEQIEDDTDQLSLEEVHNIVSRELSMDMKNRNAKSRMMNLFIEYHSILSKHNIQWMITEHPKIAADQIIDAVKPYQLQKKLRNTCNFRQRSTKKEFSKFRKYALELATAFRMIDNGLRTQTNRSTTQAGSASSNATSSTPQGLKPSKNQGSIKLASRSPNNPSRPAPPCPYPTCQQKGLRHWISDCRSSNDEEKQKMRDQLVAIKNAKGPASSTRSRKGSSSSEQPESDQTGNTFRRIQQQHKSHKSIPEKPSGIVKLSSGKHFIEATGRFDDGSDDSIVSHSLAERALKEQIGQISPIPSTKIQMPVSSTKNPITFTCTRTLTVPRTILEVSSGNLALMNISYLVVDAELSSEDLLIGRPILEHLRLDTNTLLVSHYERINNTDCSSVTNNATSQHTTIRRIEKHPDNKKPSLSSSLISRPTVNYHQSRNESDIIYDPSLLERIDENQRDQVLEAVSSLLELARKNNILEVQYVQLQEITYKFLDIFRVNLSDSPPANIPPLVVDLTSDARPVRVRLRNYSPVQRQFLKEFVNELVDAGMAYLNPTSPWAAAPVVVSRPGSEKLRFTVDLRPVNKYTIKYQYPMPNLEHELSNLRDATCYANFDFSHAYWQLPLHPKSQFTQSFITPDGIYTPTRILHGTTNAVLHLQSSLEAILPPSLKKRTIIWLDDIFIHATSVDQLFDLIAMFFHLCREHNLFLHPNKCILYTTSIRWCGRLITPSGIQFDPNNFAALKSMQEPTTAAHLQQFLCAMQWIKTAIPDFAKLVSPLHNILEAASHLVPSRKKTHLARIKLTSIGWDSAARTAFQNCKNAIEHQVTLAHRDVSQRLCLYTDASDTTWSAFLSQVPHSDLHLPCMHQRHEPLAFLSGRFNNAQLRWSTIEKESFAILASTRRLHWMLATPEGFDIYTDHNNLIFLFDPLHIVPDLSQTSVKKVLRWAVMLSLYNYTCVHVRGKDNVWADLLTRWSFSPVTIRRLVYIPPLLSTENSEFVWPSQAEIIRVQNQYVSDATTTTIKDGLLYKNNDVIWIPSKATDMQLRICIIAHTSTAGHRGRQATLFNIQPNFYWDTLKLDVYKFIDSCIHCLSTTRGNKEPRPYGPALHGLAPNDLLQFDYIQMAPSHTDMKYILMIRDDFSAYCWLLPVINADSENAADALLEWVSTFTIPRGLMTDGGSHFRNETVNFLTKGLRVPHHFTLPYTPWSNGAVERLGREVLRIFRATLSEYQMNSQEWPALVPLLQSALNNSPSHNRKGYAPLTIFSGMKPNNPLSSFKTPSSGEIVTVDAVKLHKMLEVDTVKKLLDEIHPVVQVTLQSERAKSRTYQSKGKLPNYEVGDYVLVAREDFGPNEKLSLRWRGPRRITAVVSKFIYAVEDLRNKTTDDVHVCRLRFYHDSSLNKAAIMSHILYSETGMPVSRLLGIVDTDEGIKVHIRWKGLSATDDSYEDLRQVYEDVPQMVKRLLKRNNIPKGIARRAKRALGL